MSLNRTLAGLIDTAGDVKTANLDNVSAGLTVYATLDDLPTTGLTSGDQAYVSATSRFYISNGSGWYNVALVNATPNLTISPTGQIELSTEGATTTITLTGTDSDYPDANLTYSVESDGSFAGMASISQDSSVFTITPLSEDSATTTESTLTFKASDGISFGSASRSISLSFTTQNSSKTMSLIKADTSFNDNQIDASTNSHTITENGNVTSTAFSPYHPGGYSTYFDGSGDYIQAAYSSGFDLDADFTIEAWIYPTALSGNHLIVDTYEANVDGSFQLYYRGTSGNSLAFYTEADMVILQDPSSSTIAVNNWYHVAVTRSGTSCKMFIDGTEVDSVTNSRDLTHSNNIVIGRQDATGTNYWNGYVRDVRVVKGTALYTTTFTPPTAPLTAISNTQLLTCHLPYIADGSTNDATITINGNTKTNRVGPYDYLPYIRAQHGGSLYCDGTGDGFEIASAAATQFGTDEWTMEGWFYPYDQGATQVLLYGYDANHAAGQLEVYIGTNGARTSPQINGDNGDWATSATSVGSSVTWQYETWNHIVWSRSGNNLRIFVNGKSGANHAISASQAYDQKRSESQFLDKDGSSEFRGYVSDFRIVKGDAVYTSNFTPPTSPLTAITGTELLTCTNRNDIVDAAEGRQIIKSGSDASNTQRKFATAGAIYFDGTSGLKYDPGVDNPLYNFSTHDWTIEFWFRPNNGAATYTLLSMIKNNSGSLHNTPHIYMSSSNLYYYTDTNNRIIGGTPVSNTWHHLAVTRSGNVHRMFQDGTSVGSWTNAYTYAQGRLTLGNYYQSLDTLNPSNIFAGYMQDIRITKGLARYTANFTPPTAEFSG